MGKRGFVIGKEQTRQKETKFKLKTMTGKENYFGENKRSHTVQGKTEGRSSKKRKKETLKS